MRGLHFMVFDFGGGCQVDTPRSLEGVRRMARPLLEVCSAWVALLAGGRQIVRSRHVARRRLEVCSAWFARKGRWPGRWHVVGGLLTTSGVLPDTVGFMLSVRVVGLGGLRA